MWNAHNVDSHSLAEMALSSIIIPFKGLYKIKFIEYHRRRLHYQNLSKGGIKKNYGSTISLGLQRGSSVQYKNKILYVGGHNKNTITLCDIETRKRIFWRVKLEEIIILYARKYTTLFNKEKNEL